MSANKRVIRRKDILRTLAPRRLQPRALYPALHRTAMALAAAGLALGMLSGTQARADNLAQMLYDVYDYNPEIRAEEAALKAREAATKKAGSAFAPKVSVYGSQSIVETRLKRGGTSRTRTSQYGLSASQRIFDGFQNHNNLVKAKYEERSSAYKLRNRERELLLEAVKAYMDVYAARNMIKLRRHHLANMEKQRRATVARIRAGELTRTDLSKTDTLLFRARASLEGAIADLGASVARYEALVGYQPGDLIFPQMPVRYMPKTPQEAERKAEQMHPDLRAARATIMAAQHAVKSAQGAFLPTLDASGDLYRNADSSVSETDRAEGSFALRLSLPIFDGGARQADVERARAEHSQQKYLSHGLAARIKADAHEQFLRQHAAQASLKQASAEVKAAHDLLKGIRIEEQAGQRSYLDILDAEVAYLDAQEMEIYSKADSVIAIYSYLAATGQLTVSGARKAYVQHDPQARAAVERAQKLRGATAETSGTRKIARTDSQDPWSGMR